MAHRDDGGAAFGTELAVSGEALMPDISVVLATYNRAGWLREALVPAASHVPFVDDAGRESFGQDSGRLGCDAVAGGCGF